MITVPCEKVVCNNCKETKEGGFYLYDDQNTTNLIRHIALCNECFEGFKPHMEEVQKILNSMNDEY